MGSSEDGCLWCCTAQLDSKWRQLKPTAWRGEVSLLLKWWGCCPLLLKKAGWSKAEGQGDSTEWLTWKGRQGQRGKEGPALLEDPKRPPRVGEKLSLGAFSPPASTCLCWDPEGLAACL